MLLLPLAFAITALIALGCSPPHAEARAPNASDGMMADMQATERVGRVVVYASEGERLHALALKGETGELALTASVSLPERVHYAAADREGRFLYVSTSDGSTRHALHAFRIDPVTGALTEHGPPLVPALGRIIHLSIDPSGRHLVLAHNRAAQLSSVTLAADGRLEGFVALAAPAETGFFAHQALLDGTGAWLVACGLGADASDNQPEQPGSLGVFEFREGQLTRRQMVLPGRGLGARHLDYRGEQVFVAMERGNRLFSYRFRDGVLDERPQFDVSTLRDPAHVVAGQRAGAIHVHPSGRYLYVTNRAAQTRSVTLGEGRAEVLAGGENDLALFSLDATSGEPRLVEHYDTRGVEPRTFTLEPAGRFLVVGNQSERNVLDASGALRAVPRSLVVFAIGDDGRLSHRQTYELSRGEVFWVGSVQLPDLKAAQVALDRDAGPG